MLLSMLVVACQHVVYTFLSSVKCFQLCWIHCMQEATGGSTGIISYVDPDSVVEGVDSSTRRIFMPFEGSDVKSRASRLNRGDAVTFYIAADARTGKLKATQVMSHALTAPVLWPFVWLLCCYKAAKSERVMASL